MYNGMQRDASTTKLPPKPESGKLALLEDVVVPRIFLPDQPAPHVHRHTFRLWWGFHPHRDQHAPQSARIKLIFNAPEMLGPK